MITQSRVTTGNETWRQVIALLIKASDRGYEQASENRAMGLIALGSHILAAEATALLPNNQDQLIGLVVLDDQVARLDAASLIQTAEQLTAGHSLDQLPPGASAVILELTRLAGRISR